MACSHMDACELFPELTTSSALKVWQTFYCSGDFSKCERYKKSLEGKVVPITMLPNGKQLDARYLSEKSRAKAGVAVPAAKSAAATATSSTIVERPHVASNDQEGSLYYIRFKANGAGSELQKQTETILSELGIGIASALKKSIGGGNNWFIVITDQAPEADIYRAAVRIEGLSGTEGQVKCIKLESLP